MQDTKKRRSTGQTTLFDVAKYAGVGTMTVSQKKLLLHNIIIISLLLIKYLN
jgi:Bacterial regulatory proteins, lacI family.